MNIETVKKVGNSYLVNGALVVPDVSENIHCRKIYAWLDQGNALDPEFTDTEIIKANSEKANAECTRRIEAQWNQVGQVNAALGIYSDENAEACKNWIAVNRHALEALLNRADLLSLDVTDDQYWPVLS